MGVFSTFAATGSVKKTFTTTPKLDVFINTANVAMSAPTTVANNVFLVTAKNSSAFPTTTTSPVFPVVSGISNAFVVTPDPNAPTLLVLKIGTLDVNVDCSSVSVPDGTGEYVAGTNPGGYTPEADAIDPLRPKRSELVLWTVYRNWSDPNSTDVQFPTSQAQENDVDYVYPLSLTAKGVYEIILIAAPVGEVYANYIGMIDLDIQAKQYPGWFVASVGITIDCALTTCLNNKRWDFLSGVMCGHCDEEYLEFYSNYVGMLSANDVQDWASATLLYEKLLTKCSEIGCDCGC
jgi:hypothetical protein